MAKLKVIRARAVRATAMLYLLAMALAGPLSASALAESSVDLELVLAVDASGSVDQVRFDLQKQGYAAAFHNPGKPRKWLSSRFMRRSAK